MMAHDFSALDKKNTKPPRPPFVSYLLSLQPQFRMRDEMLGNRSAPVRRFFPGCSVTLKIDEMRRGNGFTPVRRFFPAVP
ncbi:hypothetical protein ACFL6N_01040 [Thermodesulfobacteriota bacterium]